MNLMMVPFPCPMWACSPVNSHGEPTYVKFQLFSMPTTPLTLTLVLILQFISHPAVPTVLSVRLTSVFICASEQRSSVQCIGWTQLDRLDGEGSNKLSQPFAESPTLSLLPFLPDSGSGTLFFSKKQII